MADRSPAPVIMNLAQRGAAIHGRTVDCFATLEMTKHFGECDR